jgi:hypothetical protein
MTDVLIGDSAYPPATYPTSFNGTPIVGWCVYIGGNATHVWTAAEFAALLAEPWLRYVVPIFVRSDPATANPVADAAAAIAWAKANGQPSGTTTMWDGETAVDPAYFTAVDQSLQSLAGLHELLYGSKATVVQNTRTSGGYDEANWTGAAYAPGDTADQFASFSAYDLGEFDTSLLWDLHPELPTPPPAHSSEDDMAQDQNGYVTFSWPEGSRHIVQVAFDTIGGNQPDLRAVLLLPTGPLVLAESWKPDSTEAGKVLRFPATNVADAYGLELQPVGAPARYAACVV